LLILVINLAAGLTDSEISRNQRLEELGHNKISYNSLNWIWYYVYCWTWMCTKVWMACLGGGLHCPNAHNFNTQFFNTI